MNTFALASPWLLGLLAALVPWDGTELLNRMTASSLQRRDLLGERRVAQAYGPRERQRADVYLPPDSLARPHGGWPLVVFFYGGSWRSGERADYAFVGRSLASRGVAVVVADYRLYPEALYPDFIEDSARAVAWAWGQATGWQVDRARVFVMGHSAGAYNAAMVALDARWLQPHGLAPAQLAGFIGLAGPYNFLPLRVASLEPIFGHPHPPADSQPVVHASASAPPSWLFTAASDAFVHPVLNTDSLAFRLRSVGARVETRSLPRTSHVTLVAALASPLNWLSPVLDEVSSVVLGAPGLEREPEPEVARAGAGAGAAWLAPE